MKTIKPTEEQALEVLARLQDKYDIHSDNGPQLVMDFDWLGHGEWPAIVWEGGPYEWATTESFALIKGGPRTMWYEPVTAWSLNIYVNARDDD